MSLAIDIDKATRVLLSDGWHDIARNDEGVSSLYFDAFELVWNTGDHFVQPKADPAGIGFIDGATGEWMFAPLNHVLAIATPKASR
jgi:hypothetical protein